MSVLGKRDCICLGLGKLKTLTDVQILCPKCQVKRKQSGSPYSQIKAGPCPEIEGSPHFRSTYERNIYRVMLKINSTIKEWDRIDYEKHRFVFEEPFRKCSAYLPDFVSIPEDWGGDYAETEITEIKGRLDERSKAMMLGFAKYYPHLISCLHIVTEAKNFAWFQKMLPGVRLTDYARVKRDWEGLVIWE